MLKLDVLQHVAAAIGVRYIVQIKVQSFGQSARERFGMLGLRIVETKIAGVRLFLQIWDSMDGTVAWEAPQEWHASCHTLTERHLALPDVVGRAAEDLVSK